MFGIVQCTIVLCLGCRFIPGFCVPHHGFLGACLLFLLLPFPGSLHFCWGWLPFISALYLPFSRFLTAYHFLFLSDSSAWNAFYLGAFCRCSCSVLNLYGLLWSLRISGLHTAAVAEPEPYAT